MCKQTKLFLFLSIVSLWFIACKKDNGDGDTPTATLSASIDGTATTFNHNAKAAVLNVSGGYGISAEGYKKDPSESQTKLSFTIVSPSPITTGTYSENAVDGSLVTMTYDYDLFLGTLYTSEAYLSATQPVTITITSISSSSVKGTFSGELYSSMGPAGTPYKNVVTNGVFDLRF